MRRLAAVLTFVGFTLGLLALPATALAQTTSPATTAAPGSLNREVSGQFTGTGSFNPPPPTCSFADQVFDGTYKSSGHGSFHLDGCVTLVGATGSSSPSFPFSGTFTLTAPDGATMNGNAAGTVGGSRVKPPPANTPSSSLDITLTPTGGTNEFANVGGVVNLTGTWHSSGVAGVPGRISGSLAGALTP